ncbi:MAG: surface lipoprotein assembly modifier, partial [Aestuariivirga sp.]
RNITCALSVFAAVLATFALSLVFLASDAKAEDFRLDAQQIAYYQSGTETARVRLLIELTQNGHADMAEALLKRFPLQGPTAANRTLFIEGLILEKRGALPQAAAKFRAALANDPRLTLVRSELAMVLVRMNEPDSAKHHLELLAADVPDPQQQAGIRSFIDSLNASHPFTFSGFISIAPSTNINQGSSHDTVYSPGIAGTGGVDPLGTIAASGQKQSGIGVVAGGSVGYSRNLTDHVQAVVAANASGSYYPFTGLTGAGLSQSAELRYLTGRGYIGLGGVASEGVDTMARALSYTSYGPRLSVLHRLSERDQLQASATYEWRNYADSPVNNGNALTISSVFTHALDSSSNVALILGYDSVTQQNAFNSYYGGTFGLGFYKELPRGFTVQGQGTLHAAQFYDQNPFTLTTRYDDNLTGSLTLTKRDWNWFGFAPSLNYTYVRNFSNISLYDFDSHSVDFRLTKDF